LAEMQKRCDAQLKDMPSVFILILNYNGWRDTIECLESVQRLSYSNYRIVVIDNGSTDGSMENIKAWATGELPVESKFFNYDPSTKPVRWIEYDRPTAEAGGLPELEGEIEDLPPNRRMILIQTGANLGYAGGNNVGIRYALKHKAEYVWLLNNDTVVDKVSLGALVSTAIRDSKVGAVGSVLYYFDEPCCIQVWGGGKVNRWLGISRHWVRPTPRQKIDYIVGASMLLSSAALKKVGLLDEAYFMYWEDTDLSFRLRRAGYRLDVAVEVKIWHKESATLGKKSSVLDIYFNTSAVHFFSQHVSFPLLPISVGLLGRFLKRALSFEWARAKAVWQGRNRKR